MKTISEALHSTIIDLNDIISIKSKTSYNQLQEHINLRNCIDKVIKSLYLESVLRDIKIQNVVNEDDTLRTNLSYLESILHNLISNGIKYSHPDRPSRIIIQSLHTENELHIAISDNGIGIDLKKYKDQIFQMYQTFHGTEREDSRGIGLYITKTQVEALGADIDVESEIGQGTTFVLRFKK